MAAHAGRSASFAAMLAVVLALGCTVTTSGFRASRSATAPPPAPSASPSSIASSGLGPSGPGAPSQAASSEDGAVHTDRRRIISRDELMTLRGLTVEQARQRLTELGFYGGLKVVDACKEGCPDDKVCYTTPSDRLAVYGDIELCRNAKLTIAPPPP